MRGGGPLQFGGCQPQPPYSNGDKKIIFLKEVFIFGTLEYMFLCSSKSTQNPGYVKIRALGLPLDPWRRSDQKEVEVPAVGWFAVFFGMFLHVSAWFLGCLMFVFLSCCFLSMFALITCIPRFTPELVSPTRTWPQETVMPWIRATFPGLLVSRVQCWNAVSAWQSHWLAGVDLRKIVEPSQWNLVERFSIKFQWFPTTFQFLFGDDLSTDCWITSWLLVFTDWFAWFIDWLAGQQSAVHSYGWIVCRGEFSRSLGCSHCWMALARLGESGTTPVLQRKLHSYAT